MLPFELAKDTPYLALSGELWSVSYEYFNRNWSCYKGFQLYHILFQWCWQKVCHGPSSQGCSTHARGECMYRICKYIQTSCLHGLYWNRSMLWFVVYCEFLKQLFITKAHFTSTFSVIIQILWKFCLRGWYCHKILHMPWHNSSQAMWETL